MRTSHHWGPYESLHDKAVQQMVQQSPRRKQHLVANGFLTTTGVVRIPSRADCALLDRAFRAVDLGEPTKAQAVHEDVLRRTKALERHYEAAYAEAQRKREQAMRRYIAEKSKRDFKKVGARAATEGAVQW